MWRRCYRDALPFARPAAGRHFVPDAVEFSHFVQRRTAVVVWMTQIRADSLQTRLRSEVPWPLPWAARPLHGAATGLVAIPPPPRPSPRRGPLVPAGARSSPHRACALHPSEITNESIPERLGCPVSRACRGVLLYRHGFLRVYFPTAPAETGARAHHDLFVNTTLVRSHYHAYCRLRRTQGPVALVLVSVPCLKELAALTFDLVLPPDCPKDEVGEFEGEAFRVVKTDPASQEDLKTYLELNLLPAANECKRGSVSLFSTLEKAIHRAEISPHLGGFVAVIQLTRAHGRVGSPSSSGHIDWWPYRGMRRVGDLTVVSKPESKVV